MSVGEFWPEKFIQSCRWELNHRQNRAEGNSGNSVVNTHGESYWTMSAEVAVPTDSPYVKIWSSFFRRRQGAVNTFTANRSFQSFPQDAGITTDELLVIASTDRALSRVVFGQGGQRHLITEGDMFGYFTAANGYYVGEISRRINSSNYEVVPPPFPPHLVTPAPRRIKPLGEFRLDGNPRPTETHDTRRWSFSATQVLRG